MPMLLGTKGSDILKWRASTELVNTLKEELNRRWEQSPSHEAEAFLEQFIGSLDRELSLEEKLSAQIEALTEGIARAASPAELVPLAARYREVVSAHFKRRRSVLALCELCNKLHDRLLDRALGFAQERMIELGQGNSPPYALLVSGERGRAEQTLAGDNRYFLLHEDTSPRFLLFLRQVVATLNEIGIPGADQALWHGSLREWRYLLGLSVAPPPPPPQEDFLAALPPFAAPQKHLPRPMPGLAGSPVALADLVFLQGVEPLGAEACAAATQGLLSERYDEPFLQLARRTIAMPLAVGRFGRWRLERSGEQRGRLNLREYALEPLVRALRVLSVHAGVPEGGSVERIHRLLEAGFLDVELAGRLLQGYQCIMQIRALLEIRGAEEGLYCAPDEFSQETETRFRNALDAVLSLQKIGYQRLIGQV